MCIRDRETTYSIANDADLDKLVMFPYGKFMVVEDFETPRTSTIEMCIRDRL